MSQVRGETWVWADILGRVTKANIKHWHSVFDAMDRQLKSKGVECYYTMVSDSGRYRFAKHFGFKTTKVVINQEIEIMRKDLNHVSF